MTALQYGVYTIRTLLQLQTIAYKAPLMYQDRSKQIRNQKSEIRKYSFYFLPATTISPSSFMSTEDDPIKNLTLPGSSDHFC